MKGSTRDQLMFLTPQVLPLHPLSRRVCSRRLMMSVILQLLPHEGRGVGEDAGGAAGKVEVAVGRANQWQKAQKEAMDPMARPRERVQNLQRLRVQSVFDLELKNLRFLRVGRPALPKPKPEIPAPRKPKGARFLRARKTALPNLTPEIPAPPRQQKGLQRQSAHRRVPGRHLLSHQQSQ